mgnify:CR=1 FL=1
MKKVFFFIVLSLSVLFVAGCTISGANLSVDKATTDEIGAAKLFSPTK